MHLSVFNLYVPDHPEPGVTLIHNTFSGGFATLDSDTLALVQRADRGEQLSEQERARIDPDLFDDAVGVLVESREADEAAYRAWHERRRSSTRELHAIVSVTFACNFACTYCCQDDVLDGKMMSAETGAQTAAWLAARARDIAAGAIVLSFVGGEPLLHPDRIEQIVGDLRRHTEDLGIPITFELLTNGVFLTPGLVDRWLPLGLQSAQVTLDGDETTHGLTRRSKRRGHDSFATIFANVIDASTRIRIVINGNYQTDTVHGFVPLLKKLHDAGLPRGARIRFSPALTVLGAPSDAASGSCTWSGSSPELMIALSDEILRAGFDPGDVKQVGPCGFHHRHYYTIDPEGHLYKCPGFLGHADWAIGHAATGLTARYDELTALDPQRACGSCAHRPDCGGGCLAAAWLKEGKAEGVNCELEYFDRYKDDLLKRKYALAISDSPEAAFSAFPPAVPIPTAPPDAPRARGRSVALRVIG